MKERFPTRNEDREYIPLISSLEVNPVFVMGFHRSGTTVIYDSIAKCFPLANLDLYSIFFYNRLLSNFVNKNEQSDRQWFNEYIDYLGIKDRGLDGFKVRDNMVEEYCWALSRNNKIFSSMKTMSWEFPKLKEICRKLTYCTPGAQGVLLKNPFDFPNAKAMLKHFPNAKFVFIKRKPSDIFNSALNSCIKMMQPHPFFSLMINAQPAPTRAFLRLAQRLNEKRSAESALKMVSYPIKVKLKAELISAKKSLSSLPESSYVVVDYEEFNRDPAASLFKIQKVLGMEFSSPPNIIEPKPRVVQLLDVTKQYAEELDSYAW